MQGRQDDSFLMYIHMVRKATFSSSMSLSICVLVIDLMEHDRVSGQNQ